jgi:DNA modification methylase
MDLRNGDCLEVMKELEKDSVDLLFADLPYGQTSCKWDCLIDLDLFWKQANRVCKPDAPMVFTCTVKFGNTLINSNPKNFRYDLIWVKSAPCGFLNAKKMPMKKHEMIYVFYNKIPKVYTENIALHHKHKFLKEENKVIKETNHENAYNTEKRKKPIVRSKPNQYEPPLPNSVIKEENIKIVKRTDGGCDSMYGKETGKVFIYDEKGKLRNSEPRYEPPLPNSVIKYDQEHNSQLYGEKLKRDDFHESRYEPPLPNSILEVKSEKGKHATQKPVALMEWILKYYSREGGVVLDPTMGSGSMGVACLNKNRTFIGVEKDETIYKVALERCGL